MTAHKVKWRFEGETIVETGSPEWASYLIHDAVNSTQLYGGYPTAYEEPEILAIEEVE